MSTSSTWSARSSTQSGTVSCCRMPVILATRSFKLARCWTLTVVMTAMPSARTSSTSSHRQPASRDVGVGELVDQRPLRVVLDQRLDIHLLEGQALVGQDAGRDDLKAVEHLDRPGTPVGLGDADNHVGASGLGTLSLPEH